jgi:cyclopropane fatty-acyl-phospholipid synthase-like methyltransferase
MELFRNGEFRPGRILDVGCGTGENALFLASQGYDVVGIDIVPAAIRLAKEKAKQRNVKLEFRVVNALKLQHTSDFENVIDSGLFHTFSDDERPVYAHVVHRALSREGNYFMMCFSDKEPENWGGPRRISKNEITRTFVGLFKVNYIRDALFETRIHENGGKAYLTSATKAG